LEAIKEAEDRRKEKHRKMEVERENMRQDIRDKVNILSTISHCYILSHQKRALDAVRARAYIFIIM
jgi:hypothetical protein